MRRRILGLALLSVLGSGAEAHEYWLMPSRFTAAPGERIGIAHRVGSGWPGEPLPRDPARVRRFTLVDAQGQRPIAGAAGADPAGSVILRSPGLSVAVYHSSASPLQLDAAAFESYLREEGLERIVAERAARGASAQPGRELFVRHAKALVAVGEPAAAPGPFDRPVGLDLELVPETDPRPLAGGGSVAVRLLHLGRPLAGALVKAIAEAPGEPRIEQRSDADGRVVFALPRGGVWLINAVHMTEAPPGSDADWQSLWSSLTLQLPAVRSPGRGDAPAASTASGTGSTASATASRAPATASAATAGARVEFWVDLADPAGAGGADRRQQREAEQARVAARVRELGGEVTAAVRHARHALLVRIAPEKAADLRRIDGVVRVAPARTLHPPELMRTPRP